MKYLRSVGNGKIILNPIALLILLSVTCSSCQKKINVTPNSTNSDTLINRSSPVNQPQLIETEYQVVNNTRITLSSYVSAYFSINKASDTKPTGALSITI
jgi:hypothetical protein